MCWANSYAKALRFHPSPDLVSIRLQATQWDEGELNMTFRLTLGIRSWMLGMVVLVASTCSEGGAQEGVTAPKSSLQAVILTDLEGAKIKVKLVTEMLAQREGRQGPVTQEADWQIYVEPEGKISFSFRPTSHTSRGTRAGQIRAT